MRLKKGSKEAKLYMAKIRAKRNKNTVGSLPTIGSLPFTGQYLGVKLLVTKERGGIGIRVGSYPITYRKGDSQKKIAEHMAKALKLQSNYEEHFEGKNYNKIVNQLSKFVSTLKDELPNKIVKPVATTKSVQRGKSNTLRDQMYKAKAPGKRKSKTGKTYYESRKNRSDAPGQLTGTNKSHKDTKSHNVNIRVVSGVGNLDTTNIQELQRLLRMNAEMIRHIDNIKTGPNPKSLLAKATILRFRQNLAYNKKRIADLKKLIK